MAASKITVVISQGQGRNPVRRQLEEDIATILLTEPGVDVSLVPHLYDMSNDHTGMLFLRSVPGNLVVLSWLYDRATRWTLDRAGVRGHEGISLLKSAEEDREDEEDEENDDAPKNGHGIGSVNVPKRRVYAIDLRCSTKADDFIREVRRIAEENTVQTVELMSWIGGSPKPEQLQRYLQPERMLEARRAFDSGNATLEDKALLPEDTGRRWYPVIDYSRCTNCMECIDFCLFGVYGLDRVDTILVEQPDNCRKGCPACSRVCPENAIIFPQHKTPAIAGSAEAVGGLKIDLSLLFGGGTGQDAITTAVSERDEQLLLAGRSAVGASVGIPKRQDGKSQQPKDDLDKLMDALDDF